MSSPCRTIYILYNFFIPFSSGGYYEGKLIELNVIEFYRLRNLEDFGCFFLACRGLGIFSRAFELKSGD